MSWKGTGLARDESEAFKRLWPHFRSKLGKRGKEKFEVDEFVSWINWRECGVHAIKGDRGKLAARERHPGAVILNAQNALYHLSASSPRYVIHDEQTGQQITLLKRVKRLTYRVVL